MNTRTALFTQHRRMTYPPERELDYIHQNPVRQEIVESPEDYLYSSARNYHGQDGILKVTTVR